MARAQGARAQMALAFETTYGTPPVGGFTAMPFASSSLGAEQPLLTSELLGYGRDPIAPIKDAVTADGDVVVPIDADAFGFWLKAAFGEPMTTGAGPWTHEFRSGGWTLPSLAAVVSCVGVGFKRRTHSRWQIVHNDGSGTPTLIDASSTFALATDAVVTLIVAAAPNAGSVWVRIVDEPSGTVFERELTTDLPGNTQFLAPRLFMNNGVTAAAVAFDCSGLYIETDY